MKSFATNVKGICWKKVLTAMLSVTLTFSCVQLSLPSASALEADGLSSCATSKTAALSDLKDLIAQAQEVSLKGEDPELAADVEYALAQAKSMTPQNTTISTQQSFLCKFRWTHWCSTSIMRLLKICRRW